jgi:hypothetical protein
MKKIVISLVLALSLGLTACSTAWLTTFEGYLKIAGPILIQLLDIVALAGGKAPDAALQAKITADAASLNTLAASVSSASAQNVQGACAQFNLGVTTFGNDLTAVEQLANIGSSTSAEIQAAFGIAQAVFDEVEVPIAACAAAPTSAAALKALQKGAATAAYTPNSCVKAFNAVVDKKHHVHLHSWPVRVLSFGHLQ